MNAKNYEAKQSPHPQTKWLILSLFFSTIYSLLGLLQAFSHKYIIQDDARQHVFWMARFLDPELFPNDLIADYFQSVAPPGYTALYQLIASFNIDPIVLSKLLPPVLGLITTFYCFACVVEIFPVPVTGFIATLILNQNLWLKDDLASGTPRAFLYPLLLAFMYYLMRRSLLPVCGLIVLQGLFYPHLVFICTIILSLRLVDWQHWGMRSRERKDYWLWATGLGVGVLVMLPYVLERSEFGATITADRARLLTEFSPNGRTSFFLTNPWQFWLFGQRSGLLPSEWNELPYKYFLWMFGIGLSLILLYYFPRRFPAIAKLNGQVAILPQLALASVGMFFLAHALLFKLHLPSRYTQHSLRVLMAISAAIAIVVVLDSIFRRQGKVVALSAIALTGIIILTYPFIQGDFPEVAYKKGKATQLYEFLARQPKDILIASLAEEGGNLPSFAKRSVLTARQYAIPYHIGYNNQIRQRTVDLINAQYSSDGQEVKGFIQKYGVDFWLLEKTAFTLGYLTEDSSNANRVWIRQYQPAADAALANLRAGVPVLEKIVPQCSVLEVGELVVVSAGCAIGSL